MRLSKILPIIMIAAGIIGMIASFALTYDKLQVLQNPDYQPSCNINPILSCGSIMSSEQSNLLGVPNTIFGLIAFSMLVTFGAILAGGAKVKKQLWQAAQIAATGGVIFMHYLFFQGVYRLNAICIWCFTVWMVTIPVFWYITVYNLENKNITLFGKLSPVRNFILKNHGNILAAWYLTIFIILLQRFWYFWSSLVG